MIRRPITFAFILLFVHVLTGQNTLEKVDSIYRYALDNPTDSNALNVLNDALINIYSDNSDTAIYYAKNQVIISQKRGWGLF